MRNLKNSLLSTAKKFQSNEDGYFAALFGIMLISITATSGAAVDFMTVQNTRSVVQQALDTTTLALQPLIHTQTEAQIKVKAQDLLDQIADIQGFELTVEQVDEAETDGSLFIEVSVDVPMYFVSLVGVDQITARIASQVTKKATSQEIVMVLDNSGSMSWYSRMSNLKTAAENATEILMASATAENEVKIGIVPFTFFVNVGASNSTASWIDQAGNADISNDNFDDDDNDGNNFTGAVDRLALYNQLGIDWDGCVDARAHYVTGTDTYLDTDDTAPTAADPNTLFTPSFAPDESDRASVYNDYMSDSAGSCSRSRGLSDTERQERLCKYTSTQSVSSNEGPNDGCPASAILPLTTTKSSVLSAINGMNASGATNIHQGAIWGFRTLSPSEPFTEGGDYDQDLSKIMIIMTDGENTNYSTSSNDNGAWYYSAYGYPTNERLGEEGWSSSQLEAEMDNRTELSCEAAKDEDITVYTIGLDPPNTATRTMLENCASSLSHAFFPSAASELTSVFQTIANEILSARIAQ